MSSSAPQHGAVEELVDCKLLPPRLDQRLFRHELTPVWLNTAARLTGESVEGTGDIGRVAWIGSGAWVTPAVVAAVHPSASVHVWDPDPSVLNRVAAIGRDASLDNMQIYGRRSAPEAGHLDLCDLVVLDGLVDSIAAGERDALITKAASLLRPGGLLAVHYRTVVGWGEVAPLIRALRSTIAGGTAKNHHELLAPLQVLRSRGAAYPAVRPVVGAWLDELLDKPAAEVIDHWSADDLSPLSHAQLCRAAAVHGAEFVTSAHVYDPLTAAPPALARQVWGAPTAVLRETLSDLAVRRTQRIDLFRLGRSRVDERKTLMPASLDVASTVGVSWAEPQPAVDRLACRDSEASILQARMGSVESLRLRDMWAGKPPRQRESLARAGLGSGQLHPVVGQVAADVEEAAARLTRALAGRGRTKASRYSVVPVLGTAVPSNSVAELDEDGRRALGIAAA